MRYIRELIKLALLQLNIIIPIIKSFYNNYKYLSISISIIKELILDIS